MKRAAQRELRAPAPKVPCVRRVRCSADPTSLVSVRKVIVNVLGGAASAAAGFGDDIFGLTCVNVAAIELLQSGRAPGANAATLRALAEELYRLAQQAGPALPANVVRLSDRRAHLGTAE